MKKSARSYKLPLVLGTLLALVLLSSGFVVWGFYAHREINRLAVHTIPAPLARFYKRYSVYVETHAIDPDKRRYAAKLEGPRHFIDMERFGDGTIDALPKEFWEFHDRYTSLWCISGRDSAEISHRSDSLHVGNRAIQLSRWDYADWYRKRIEPAHRYELDTLDWVLPKGAPSCKYLRIVDTMTIHGVLPYHLVEMQRRLTNAFRQNDQQRILQLSAEIGHYIADASVPLHTTENYNGQLTGQRGIHAFWESRLPELFAAANYDVLVGRAEHISDPTAFYRGIVEKSHSHVDSVLLIEADLRRKVPEDQQECYEERLGAILRVPCAAFSKMYSDRLNGMVETRFRDAIHAVGSSWYTAWFDAGEPALDGEVVDAKFLSADSTFRVVPGLDGQGH